MQEPRTLQTLTRQKEQLIKEIDELEQKLHVLHEFNVDGKITLQCGTQTMINPQFHLKLDPRDQIEYCGIFAIQYRPRMNNNQNEIRLPTTSYSLWEYNVIPLWERHNRMALD